jgi:hypothetical protein
MAYLGEEIKKLGFGLMRLPMLGKEVDIEQTKEMVDLFLEAGFTYFDTAYGYLGGKSEEAVKTCLVDRYPRESFQLATKLPAWAGAEDAEAAKQMFYTSLERTGAGYFDFYLLHNLGAERTEIFEKYDIWNYALELKEKGLIRHLGFSMHDTAEALEQVLIAHPEAEFVQLQINYADWENEKIQSRKCYEVARKYNKPVIIMEPVKGGALAKLPEHMEKLFKDADSEASVASWAVRYAASLEGLVTVLSGMSNVQQMKDNLSFMKDFKPLSEKEQAVVASVVDALEQMEQIPCTDCKYCMKGCPEGVLIPEVFSSMNTYLRYNNVTSAQGNYNFVTRNGGKAGSCIGCGQCEAVCPQHIGIIEELKKASALFDK